MKTFKKWGSALKKTVKSVSDKINGSEESEDGGASSKPTELMDFSSQKKPVTVGQEADDDLLDYYPLDHIHSFDTMKLPARVRAKVENFQKILSSNIIDIKALRQLSFQGIPDDCPGLRSIVWRLLLGILPCEKSKWEKNMKDDYDTYTHLVKTLVYDVETPEDSVWLAQEQAENEYYLSKTVNKDIDPKHAKFFLDRDQWVEVEKDTTRTRSEMHFFVTDTQNSTPFKNPFKMNAKTEEKHFDVLSRILFVYAKINPGIKYVQGMNEILALFYHVYLNDRAFSSTLESDSFFSFTILMGEVKDCFMKVLDDSDSGIKARVNGLNQRLKVVDFPLWNRLEDLNLNPQFYSLRWIMLIFTQEFEIFDVMRLWDSYIAQQDKQTFLDFVCIAILQIQNDHIRDDFAEAMESLQRIQNLDILQIISHANKLYQTHCPQK